MERITVINSRRLISAILLSSLHSAFTGYMLMVGIGDVVITGIFGIMSLVICATAISVPVALVLGLVPMVEKVYFPIANILSSMVMTIYIIPFAVGCHC